MIQIFTGNGKGKTTAALGLIIRALGHGWRVCLIQFMKKDFRYGEIEQLKKLSGIDIFQFGTDQLIDPDHLSEIDYTEAEKAWEKARDVILSDNYDLIVLDEINVAVAWNLLPVSRQLELMALDTSAELVMTGRYAHTEVLEKADLVTEMKEIKHYFQKGISAREGIEF
ncbi:MAG: cob(I)yrinic acid a,c-diamide adenosyltransferase [Candidatus Cloacimonetes bacterium]|nr:cob(I)yrinic acid a,c-diamide adenosyltransferase [Candidatus Cloacimonadota bacterium]